MKTYQGFSKDYYSNLVQDIYEILQGSESTPGIWLAVSLILIQIFNTTFHDDSIPDLKEKNQITRLIDCFVNNSDL